MELQGLDYNTQRSKVVIAEYGREIQQMVDYAVSLPTKEQRQACAESIINTMKRIVPSKKNNSERMQTLWTHLAVMSEMKLDIDYPYDVTSLASLSEARERIPYPRTKISVRHYGKTMFAVFEQLKTMEPGPARDSLVSKIANQMKRCLVLWGHGTTDNQKIADDLARYTDGAIQLDLSTFKFDTIDMRNLQQTMTTKKKKKK